MLQHVVKAQVLDHVVFSVDELVGERELSLNHERGRIAVPAGRRVIGACIAAFGLDIWDVTILDTHPSAKVTFVRHR